MYECLFSTWRYFIGRRSIQAASAPGDIARFFGDNRQLYPQSTIKFMASDIRNEVSYRVNLKNNVMTYGFNSRKDALSLISEYLISHRPSFDRKWLSSNRFLVDMAGEQVTVEKNKSALNLLEPGDWHTYMGWVLLADALDPSREVYLKYTAENGETKEESKVCTCRYVLNMDSSGNYKCVIRYTDVESFLSSGNGSMYLTPEYITEIKNLTIE